MSGQANTTIEDYKIISLYQHIARPYEQKVLSHSSSPPVTDVILMQRSSSSTLKEA